MYTGKPGQNVHMHAYMGLLLNSSYFQKCFEAVRSQSWMYKKRFAGSKSLNNLQIAKDDIDKQ